jgi:hypothetical protein
MFEIAEKLYKASACTVGGGSRGTTSTADRYRIFLIIQARMFLCPSTEL